jgi:signal peptidase I
LKINTITNLNFAKHSLIGLPFKVSVVVVYVVLLILTVFFQMYWFLAWLNLFVIVLSIINAAASQKNPSSDRKSVRLSQVVFIPLVFLFGIFTRIFFFEVNTVSSSSMKSTLKPGDIIFVNKLAYGPIIPQSFSEIPFVSLMFSGKEEKFANPPDDHNDIRLNGYSDYRVGDIVIFRKGRESNMQYVKRCIALPGSTLEVSNGIPSSMYKSKSLDKSILPIAIWTCFPHLLDSTIESKDFQLTERVLKHDCSHRPAFTGVGSFSFVERINQNILVDSITVMNETKSNESAYLKSLDTTWTIYSFGPIYIPKMRDEINLDQYSYNLYKDIICRFENNCIEKKGPKFFIDGQEVKSYTFRKNYYFMMGDNRENSNDSRYFGLIPESDIIGRVDLILCSVGGNHIKWNRTFKGLY